MQSPEMQSDGVDAKSAELQSDGADAAPEMESEKQSPGCSAGEDDLFLHRLHGVAPFSAIVSPSLCCILEESKARVLLVEETLLTRFGTLTPSRFRSLDLCYVLLLGKSPIHLGNVR
ncbi:hypothetical protein L2E82_30560 [Cichorium intybus]|uniref:Uncharacterized protein n=1 Tax=Cichorium intybus TaxID=13427 RepID=A0ACB9D0N6_CICIN|nr:hypothetical protein L2E82_30560 [Cichorium intybus]